MRLGNITQGAIGRRLTGDVFALFQYSSQSLFLGFPGELAGLGGIVVVSSNNDPGRDDGESNMVAAAFLKWLPS